MARVWDLGQGPARGLGLGYGVRMEKVMREEVRMGIEWSW